jgi:hypothetical protein
MAEALIMRASNTSADIYIDKAQCFKRGMFVDIKPNGFDWGGCANNSKFFIAEFPDYKESDLKKYIAPELDESIIYGTPIVRPREWLLEIDKMPQQFITAWGYKRLIIGSTGLDKDILWPDFKTFLKNQKGNYYETVDL